MAEPEGTTPTWGYHRDGRSQLFNLKPGERLPEGWADAPAPGMHPQEARNREEAQAHRAAEGKPGASAQDEELQQLRRQTAADREALEAAERTFQDMRTRIASLEEDLASAQRVGAAVADQLRTSDEARAKAEADLRAARDELGQLRGAAGGAAGEGAQAGGKRSAR